MWYLILFLSTTGTILLDTVNLSSDAGRTTPKDIEVLDKLQKFCPNVVHQDIFDSLQRAKFDISGKSCSLQDHLYNILGPPYLWHEPYFFFLIVILGPPKIMASDHCLGVLLCTEVVLVLYPGNIQLDPYTYFPVTLHHFFIYIHYCIWFVLLPLNFLKTFNNYKLPLYKWKLIRSPFTLVFKFG